MIGLKDKEMNKIKKELEILKSWGIESVPVDKLMSMIEETKDDISVSSERRDMRVPSEAFDETVWTWSYYSQHWFSYIKYDEASVFFIRAF